MPESTTGSFQPIEQLQISTLETLKVFSDPLRQQIIEALLDGSKTVKQVAAKLDHSPTKLYYHVNLLEEHGLIRVTETRIVSGIIEKHYQSAARSFLIHRALLTPGRDSDDEALDAAFDAMIEPIRTDIHKGIRQGIIDMSDDSPQHRKLRMWRAMSSMSEEQAEAFYARLEMLIQEFNGFRDEETNAGEQGYGLMISIFPANVKPKKL